MFATKATFGLILICICQLFALSASASVAQQINTDDLSTCEEQLSKYRRFILQAIISFEDVCDAYTSHMQTPNDGNFRTQDLDTQLFRRYQPSEQRSEIWAFFKLFLAQFNDVDFVNVIRDAVIERCRVKLQRDEKRNSVVLGKKQRFHSWGGKRSQALPGPPPPGQLTIDDQSAERTLYL